MSLFSTLGILLIRDVGQGVAGTMAGRAATDIVEHLRELLSQRRAGLLQAMRQASERAWLAVEIALAGDGYAGQLTANPSAGQVQSLKAFLAAGWFGQSTADRGRALEQLRAARSVGTLDPTPLADREIDGVAGNLDRYADATKRREGDRQTLTALVAALKSRGPDLARILTDDLATGSPLLSAAASEFFRQALQADAGLAAVPVPGAPPDRRAALEHLTRFLLNLGPAGSDSHGGTPSPDVPATPAATDIAAEVQTLLGKIRQRPDAADLQKCAALLRQLRREGHPQALALLRQVRQTLAAHLPADALTFLPRGNDRAGVMPARAAALARAIQFTLWDDPA